MGERARGSINHGNAGVRQERDGLEEKSQEGWHRVMDGTWDGQWASVEVAGQCVLAVLDVEMAHSLHSLAWSQSEPLEAMKKPTRSPPTSCIGHSASRDLHQVPRNGAALLQQRGTCKAGWDEVLVLQ